MFLQAAKIPIKRIRLKNGNAYDSISPNGWKSRSDFENPIHIMDFCRAGYFIARGSITFAKNCPFLRANEIY
jgi:hypothetical protein